MSANFDFYLKWSAAARLLGTLRFFRNLSNRPIASLGCGLKSIPCHHRPSSLGLRGLTHREGGGLIVKEEQHQFMRLLGHVPARLMAERTAWAPNCQPHDVPILVAAKLLKPLGNLAPNSVKFFAALEVLEQAKDRTRLAKVTNALNQYGQKRNADKRSQSETITA